MGFIVQSSDIDYCQGRILWYKKASQNSLQSPFSGQQQQLEELQQQHLEELQQRCRNWVS